MSRIVHTAPNEAEAQPVRDLLEAHGIPSRVGTGTLGALGSALALPDRGITVEVLDEADVERARDLLASSEAVALGDVADSKAGTFSFGSSTLRTKKNAHPFGGPGRRRVA